MGLNQGDLEKVPKRIKAEECYERIYNWHKKHGERRMKEKYKRDDDYSRAYIELVKSLPTLNKSPQEDIDFVFGQVIGGLMEWSYHVEDEHGIKIAAYAHFALGQQYGGFGTENFRNSMVSSKLYAKFYPK